ncbi:MAG TPA: hypothetical protein VLG46_08725 [Anaerolineae bacterium]|nr:hypothetical protein [Anaerolineae bacterium]
MKQPAWRMKRFALILSFLWLAGCAAGERSLPTLTPMPITGTPFSSPTRSLKQAPARVVTTPIDTATPISSEPGPSLTPVTRSRPTATATLPECPPLPEPTEVKTQAAVQHFEHGAMFWLQERDEIWALITSPQADQFYWRILPNLWVEGQPESDPRLQPPSGQFQPVRGFGYAWRLGGGSYRPQRADLGWALDEEIGFGTTLIYYPQGFYSPDCTWMPKSGVYELTDAQGTVYQFVGAGGIAKIVTSPTGMPRNNK